ncbi:hypothetical protein C8R43DRAFT_1110984 [Mycena crocata]|nr:hypothetical protein C8R43DRAFT_1110984 [Mycena crocata]
MSLKFVHGLLLGGIIGVLATLAFLSPGDFKEGLTVLAAFVVPFAVFMAKFLGSFASVIVLLAFQWVYKILVVLASTPVPVPNLAILLAANGIILAVLTLPRCRIWFIWGVVNLTRFAINLVLVIFTALRGVTRLRFPRQMKLLLNKAWMGLSKTGVLIGHALLVALWFAISNVLKNLPESGDAERLEDADITLVDQSQTENDISNKDTTIPSTEADKQDTVIVPAAPSPPALPSSPLVSLPSPPVVRTEEQIAASIPLPVSTPSSPVLPSAPVPSETTIKVDSKPTFNPTASVFVPPPARTTLNGSASAFLPKAALNKSANVFVPKAHVATLVDEDAGRAGMDASIWAPSPIIPAVENAMISALPMVPPPSTSPHQGQATRVNESRGMASSIWAPPRARSAATSTNRFVPRTTPPAYWAPGGRAVPIVPPTSA